LLMFVVVEAVARVGVEGAVVSTVKVNAEDVSETFNALSVATAVIERLPSLRPVVSARENLPSAPAVTVPSVAPLSEITTELPASAVPVMVGLLMLSKADDKAVRTGFAVVVSTVSETGAEAGDAFPAASVAVTVRLCAPSPRGIEGVMLNAPVVASAVAVPICVLPSYNLTVLPASAFPVTVGLFTFVRPVIAEPIVGAAGGVVSA